MLHSHQGPLQGPWWSPSHPRHTGPRPYLSYLLCRSFSICGSTVVHRSSFQRELERGQAWHVRPAPATPPSPQGHLRFLVEDVQEVHHHGQVTDGHCGVY